MQNLRIIKKWLKKFTKFYNAFLVNFESPKNVHPGGHSIGCTHI